MPHRPDAPPGRNRRAEDSPQPRRRWKRTVALAALIALAIVPYLGTVRAGFVSDDTLLLENVRAARERGGWSGLFREDLASFASGTRSGFYRPLTMLSYGIDRILYGDRPLGFHVTNLLLHLLATWLVLQLGLQLGLAWRAAVAAAALFAVHPVHVEAVAWISGRFDLLCAVFYVLSLWCYARAHARRSTRWYVASIGAFVAGLSSKEMAVTLPLAILLLEMLGLSHGSGPRRVVTRGLWAEGKRGRLWRVAPFVAVVVSYVVMRGALFGKALGRSNESSLSGLELVCTQARALLYDLGRLLAPVRLNSFEILPTVHVPWSPWFLAGSALAVGLVVIAVRMLRRSPVTSFGILFFLASLLPLSNVIPLYPVAGIRFPVAERYLYLPSVGFLLALSALGWELARRLGRRRWPVFAAGIVVLVMAGAARTMARVPVWQSNEALFDSMVRDDPKNPWAHIMRAERARALGRFEESRRDLDRAAQLDGNAFLVWLARGQLEMQAGRDAEAVPFLERAVTIKPDSREARLDLARALRRSGRLPEAAQQYATLVQTHPADVEILVNQSELWLSSGQLDAAQRNLETALRLDPRRKEAMYNLGVLALRRGDVEAARRTAQATIEIDPRYPDTYQLLGNIEVQRRDFAAAARQFEHAVELDSTLVQARVNWGAALLDSGETERAIAVLEKAVAQNASSRAWLNLGNAQSRGGVVAAAERSFRAVLQIEPDNVLAKRGLGLLLARQPGNAAEARSLLVGVGASNPEDQEVAAALRRLSAPR